MSEPEIVKPAEPRQIPIMVTNQPLRIYVAGPLNGDTCAYLANMHNMLCVSSAIRRKGHSPYIPCLDFMCGILEGHMEYQDYLNMSQPWLKVADALFFMAPSPGANCELATAQLQGIPIFTDLANVPWVKETVNALIASLPKSQETVPGAPAEQTPGNVPASPNGELQKDPAGPGTTL